jgi:hypothetical protein
MSAAHLVCAQALQLARVKPAATAETQLGALLLSRFRKGGDEMRRTLVRASMAAFTSLHTAPHPGPQSEAALPPLALQRMHQALVTHVLKVMLSNNSKSQLLFSIPEPSFLGRTTVDCIPGRPWSTLWC